MYRFYSKPDEVRVTFAGTHENGVLTVAAARCSKKDRFVKKEGRAIAEERLSKKEVILVKEMPECSGKQFVEEVLPLVDEIIKEPKKVKQA